MDLPPVKHPDKMVAALRLTPRRHRADAVQEAWVAFLEGRSCVAAINNLRRREMRHEQREPAISQTEPRPDEDDI